MGRKKKRDSTSILLFFNFTFVLKYIMGIIGNTAKDNICVSWVSFVNFLVFDIKSVMNMHKHYTTKSSKWIDCHPSITYLQ